MAAMNKYMVVHLDPNIGWDSVERNWRRLAGVESAKWERTYFNKDQGLRYCIWHAASEEALDKIFLEMDLKYDSITRVEETVPDIWGRKWQEHLSQDTKADTLAF